MKRSHIILVAALRISTFEQVASVCSEDVFIASSLPPGSGMVGRGAALWTSVKVTMCRRPWATPLMATKVKTPGNRSAVETRGRNLEGVGT